VTEGINPSVSYADSSLYTREPLFTATLGIFLLRFRLFCGNIYLYKFERLVSP